MPEASVHDLEVAANAYFHFLKSDADQPRDFDPEHFEEDVAMSVEASRARMDALDHQLTCNQFDAMVEHAAGRIARKAGGTLSNLSPVLRLRANQLAALAEREQMRFLIHALTTPALPFHTGVPAFQASPAVLASGREPASGSHTRDSGNTVAWCIERHLERRKRARLGTSTLEEVGRALEWLAEHLGPDTPIGRVTPAEMRAFRDGVERLDVRFRGKSRAFSDRQTADPQHQIQPQTAQRYWASVVAFFADCVAEGYTEANPALGMKTLRPRGVKKRTPPPFTRDELVRLLSTPPYAGHKSAHFVLEPGPVISKGSYYWCGLIALFTGMRAGEIAQLQVGDFDFDGAIPLIHLREEGEGDGPRKKLKTQAAVRDVPISPVLLALGLQRHVAKMAKGVGYPRVFPDVRLGSGDRRSDGLTKFFGRLLRQNGLHAPGRATHVFRHTVVAAMRRGGLTDEVIAGVVGQVPGTLTGRYGGTRPIEEKADAIGRID
jgi:integrase